MPSVQYLFFNEDEILFEFRSGYADLQTAMKADNNTTYNGYSVTKTFTAIAILQLQELGLLNIDTSVSQFLPELHLPKEITIKHLLTHTSGLANPLPLKWIHLPDAHTHFDRNQFFGGILKKHLKFKNKPGEKFSYSNLGYILLGQIIESVTGLTYEQYVMDCISKKVGAEEGALSFTIPHKVLHAKGYHNRFSLSMLMLSFLIDTKKFMGPATGKWKSFKNHYVNGAPYGGIIGTTDGFAKFGQAILKTDGLLKEKSKKLMFEENVTSKGKASGMSLSWFKGSLNGKDYFAHAGGGGGYYCELRIYPKAGVGSFIVFNRSGFSDERFLDKVDKAFLK